MMSKTVRSLTLCLMSASLIAGATEIGLPVKTAGILPLNGLSNGFNLGAALKANSTLKIASPSQPIQPTPQGLSFPLSILTSPSALIGLTLIGGLGLVWGGCKAFNYHFDDLPAPFQYLRFFEYLRLMFSSKKNVNFGQRTSNEKPEIKDEENNQKSNLVEELKENFLKNSKVVEPRKNNNRNISTGATNSTNKLKEKFENNTPEESTETKNEDPINSNNGSINATKNFFQNLIKNKPTSNFNNKVSNNITPSSQQNINEKKSLFKNNTEPLTPLKKITEIQKNKKKKSKKFNNLSKSTTEIKTPQEEKKDKKTTTNLSQSLNEENKSTILGSKQSKLFDEKIFNPLGIEKKKIEKKQKTTEEALFDRVLMDGTLTDFKNIEVIEELNDRRKTSKTTFDAMLKILNEENKTLLEILNSKKPFEKKLIDAIEQRIVSNT